MFTARGSQMPLRTKSAAKVRKKNDIRKHARHFFENSYPLRMQSSIYITFSLRLHFISAVYIVSDNVGILFWLLRGIPAVLFLACVCTLSLMLLSYLLWARRSSALRCPAECPVRATSDCAFLALFARFIAKKCGKSQKNAVK